jgi:hypothetical protein
MLGVSVGVLRKCTRDNSKIQLCNCCLICTGSCEVLEVQGAISLSTCIAIVKF